MTTQRKPASSNDERKPRITLTAKDYERLVLLTRAAAERTPEVASTLADELDRAHVLANQDRGRSVCMGSVVEFQDDTTGKVQTVTLVYPGEADILQRKVSVLTPVGTALIGLAANDSITWETRTGELRQLTVLKVDEHRPI